MSHMYSPARFNTMVTLVHGAQARATTVSLMLKRIREAVTKGCGEAPNWHAMYVLLYSMEACMEHGDQEFVSAEKWVLSLGDLGFGTIRAENGVRYAKLFTGFVEVIRHIVTLNPTFYDTMAEFVLVFAFTGYSMNRVHDSHALVVSPRVRELLAQYADVDDLVYDIWLSLNLGNIFDVWPRS